MSILQRLTAFFVLLAASSALGADSPPAPVSVVYRLLDADASLATRPADRRSLLFGRVEFRVRAPEAAGYEVRELVVESAVSHAGVLCRSTTEVRGSCRYDFGRDIRRHELTFLVELLDRVTGDTFEVEQQVSTLRTEPDGSVGFGEATRTEHLKATSHPPDYVTRAVRVNRLEGRGSRLRRFPVVDLDAGDFSAQAQGLGPLEIASVRPPDTNVACMVVVAWSVASHLEMSKQSLAWSDDHAPLVQQIRRGIETAARKGFQCGWLFVEYVGTPRPMYGPVFLHSGETLDEHHRTANREVLDGLVQHLLQDPPQNWGRLSSTGRMPAWETDFLSVYNTLNDLMRGYHGLVEMLVLTNGREVPTRREPRFQARLWPSGLEELNRKWSERGVEQLLAELDTATTDLDRQLSEFMKTLDASDPGVGLAIAGERARLDPGGLSSLQAHRRQDAPNVEILLLPSEGQFVENPERYLPFHYGRTWRMLSEPEVEPDSIPPAPEQTHGARTLSGALLSVQHMLRSSYLVEAVVPNPSQDWKPHGLRFDLLPRAGREDDRLELEYVPVYRSSVPLATKMPVYAGSPFKRLRLLAAYGFREHALDEAHFELLEQRLSVEPDIQVREILFESWISIQFQRLQAGPTEVRNSGRRRRYVETAYAELRGLKPSDTPDQLMAAEARAVASAHARTRQP